MTRRVTGLAHSRDGVSGQPEFPAVGDHSRKRDERRASGDVGPQGENDEDDGDKGGDLPAGGAGDEGDDGGDSETGAADGEEDGGELGDAPPAGRSTMPTGRGDSTRCFLVLGSAIRALVV